MKRLAQITVIGLLGMSAACSTMTRSPDKVQAEQRWSQVRGRVKYQLAQQQYEGGAFENAVRTVSECLALDGTQADAYVLLARAYLELGKPASAKQTLVAARRAGVHSPDLIYTEGVILEHRDQLDEALEKYARAQALNPTNVDFLIAHAECLAATGREASALALLDQHRDKVDEERALDVLAAHIATLVGDADEAARRYRSAYVSGGGTDFVAEELGLLLTRSGRHGEALVVLQPLLEKVDDVPPSGTARRTAATCYLAINDFVSAKNVLADYALAHPGDTAAQVLLAKAAIATGELWTASRAIDAAEQREPNRPEIKFVRAVIEWKRGHLDAAAASLRDVLSAEPDDVEGHCLLAEVLFTQQKNDSARRHFRRALKLDPHCAWASMALRSPG